MIARLLPLFVLASVASADHAANMAKSLDLFAGKVGGILREHCLECHGGRKVKSGFNLASREALLQGGDLGVAVVPGAPDKSPLVAFLRHAEEPTMPPKKPKLAETDIAAIEQWIALGAAYDKPLADVPADAGPLVVTDEDRNYWAFQPLQKIAPPASPDPAWAAHPVDRFIAARHREKGLRPAGTVDRRRLIRRLYFDLIGLPQSRPRSTLS